MDKSPDARLGDKQFWRGVVSSVASSLITAYVLFILGASVVFAAAGPDGSDVNLTAALSALGVGVLTPVLLGGAFWAAFKVLGHFKSIQGTVWRLLRWPYVVWTLGWLSLWVVIAIYFLGLFAVIQIRVSK